MGVGDAVTGGRGKAGTRRMRGAAPGAREGLKGWSPEEGGKVPSQHDRHDSEDDDRVAFERPWRL